MDAAVNRLVKELGRELHQSADDMEKHHSGDHATGVAAYAAADAIRRVADVIGYVLIGTEDFKRDPDDDSARLEAIVRKAKLLHAQPMLSATQRQTDANEFLRAIIKGEEL